MAPPVLGAHGTVGQTPTQTLVGIETLGNLFCLPAAVSSALFSSSLLFVIFIIFILQISLELNLFSDLFGLRS